MNIYVPITVAPFNILINMCFNSVYLSLNYHSILPQAEAKCLSHTMAYILALGLSFVLDISVHHVSPPFFKGTITLFHSPLSSKLTINGLWSAYLGIILSDLVCKMDSCIMSRDMLMCPYYKGLDFHC